MPLFNDGLQDALRKIMENYNRGRERLEAQARASVDPNATRFGGDIQDAVRQFTQNYAKGLDRLGMMNDGGNKALKDFPSFPEYMKQAFQPYMKGISGLFGIK